MSANHSPGPWEAVRAPSNDLIIEATNGDTFPPMVARISRWHDCGNRPEAEANARLIACAPDLLECLKSVIYAADCDLRHQERFAAIFSKAKTVRHRAEGGK